MIGQLSYSGDPMRVLLVEDDNFKQELVEQLVLQVRPIVEIVVARSVQQAVQLLGSGTFDLIILDMSLPSHESKAGGSQPISQPSGGIEVLLELSYECRTDRVVILTQYPEIEYDGRLHSLSRFQTKVAPSIFFWSSCHNPV